MRKISIGITHIVCLAQGSHWWIAVGYYPHLQRRWTVPAWDSTVATLMERSEPERVSNRRRSSAPSTQDADEQPFEDFLRRYQPEIFGYLWRITGEEQAAYDLCQETFLRAWKHFGKVSAYERPGAWPFRVATNLAINYQRHRSTSSDRQ